MESIKERAQVLRMGLIGRYVSIPDVVSWADALIAQDHGLVVSQLFDLALLRPTDLGRAISLLGDIPGEIDRRVVGREIAGLLHRELMSARINERDAATALFTALHDGCSPDAEFASMAYYFDDGVDLALQGAYGSLADIRVEMLEYLSRASQPNGAT